MLYAHKNITPFNPYNKSVRQILSLFFRKQMESSEKTAQGHIISDKKIQTQIHLIPKFMLLNPMSVVFNFFFTSYTGTQFKESK